MRVMKNYARFCAQKSPPNCSANSMPAPEKRARQKKAAAEPFSKVDAAVATL